MERVSMIYGGHEPKLITLGVQQTLPDRCIGIYPNADGCKITGLTDTDGVEYKTKLGIDGVDLTDKQIPIYIRGAGGSYTPAYFKTITGTAGTCWAIID